MKLIHYWGKILNPTSLQMRLTLGIAVVSILGLTGVVSWISWRMQQILIITHKNNTQYIVGRFPHDVEIYSDMVTLEEGMQKAIDNLTNTYTLLWVKTPQGKISAQSVSLKMSPQKNILVSFKDLSSQPNLQLVNGRYWLLCSTKLKVKGVNLGQFYIAQDITNDQTMFLSLIGSLSFASLIAIICMTVAIAWYIWRSLQPLARISHLTANISPEKLGEVQIELKNAPSEVKELAQTLETTLLRLADNYEHQRQLVSNVSHELRTPLTLVSGYLQSILRRGTNLTDMQRDALEIAASEANRTIQLLQDLLDLARADSGRMHFHLEPLILNELFDEVKGMVSQYNDRLIEFVLPSDKVIIKVDSNRLKQVLLNLIDNGVKYSSEQSPIMVKLVQIQEKAILEICDHGIGIPLSDQVRIFERFYRVDEARSRTTGGTGLGLSIVKTLVEGMGGSIGVTSQLGKGSTFTVSFPLCR
ncbi:sensor histidine kinase [Aphanothece sacrum]|uniref:histidine kinase n=2 Tax=Aphanothece sacrum TaxID=1122 RepID=A0A401IHA5_APHSA|nr:HAMP domain-containing sensor histidine kinase [Aphanothece sacrum]GBF80677.1 two-component sensor histidine kinase [Aphanothece sacrum FPU1]GBF83171.1 two-component sensor histidine kinase [Aphanothece sacrum FPU3]